VRALTTRVPDESAGWVHWGATSQDVLDTAAMLVARRALGLLDDDLARLANACADLAERHRDTVMAGRTLLQQALPITFGLKAAGWLVAVVEAREGLAAFAARRLAVELGGAAGTLASLRGRGLAVVEALAGELGLAVPVVPWHTARGRVAELAGLLAVAAGAAGKIALDVALLMQTEVGEASEAAAPGRGGSSTLPHKRNPVGALAVNACVRGALAQVAVLQAAIIQEHERAAGAWQSEWPALNEALRFTSGAISQTATLVSDLEVHEERMRENLDLTRGLPLSEHVMMLLAEKIGRAQAHHLVEAATHRAATTGRGLAEELTTDPAITPHLTPATIQSALTPSSYLGETHALITRALATHPRPRP
jgi:3-carboxy-cis,cis-muconate cycloisomerase